MYACMYNLLLLLLVLLLFSFIFFSFLYFYFYLSSFYLGKHCRLFQSTRLSILSLPLPFSKTILPLHPLRTSILWQLVSPSLFIIITIFHQQFSFQEISGLLFWFYKLSNISYSSLFFLILVGLPIISPSTLLNFYTSVVD